MLFRNKIRPSRAERQVRNLCRGLFWASLVLLAITISMTGRLGWSQGVSLGDRVLNATGFGAIDIVGALLMSACGVCVARRMYAAAFVVAIGAAVSICITGVAIFGFLASNRIAVAKFRDKIEALDVDQLAWLRGQTVSKGNNAQQRDTFLGGVERQLA